MTHAVSQDHVTISAKCRNLVPVHVYKQWESLELDLFLEHRWRHDEPAEGGQVQVAVVHHHHIGEVLE